MFRKDFGSAYQAHKERDKCIFKGLKDRYDFILSITQKTSISTHHTVIRALHKATKFNKKEY